MKRRNIFFCLMVIVFVFSISCIPQGTDTPQKSPDTLPSPTDDNINPSASDTYPSVSTTLSPSNPSLGEEFTFTISAEDDKGVKSIFWETSKVFFEGEKPVQTDSFICDGKKTCMHSWKLISVEEGVHKFTISVMDSSEQESKNIQTELTVQPFREKKWETDTSGTSQTNFSKPADAIPTASFTCGNAVCEGGESYESCPKDCTEKDIAGTMCNDGACEPGEDANYCPKDCETINPKCGNDVCDEGETRTTCYADCKGDSSESGNSCSTNSDCSYEQRCKSGKCVTVECTTDSNCAGCARCSDNQCRSCGYGAEGYCTC